MRLLQVLGWIALLVALGWYVLERPLPPGDGDSEALLAFPVVEPLSFALEGAEEEIKILVWLAHPPPPVEAEPGRVWEWSMQASITGPDGAPVWEEAWWLAAGDARVERPGEAPLASAWLDGGADRLTENRVTRLRPGPLPGGSRLVLSAVDVPDGARVLAAVFRVAPRSLAQRTWLLLGARTRFHAANARAVGLPGWDDLPPAWRRERVERVWERLSALPTRGGGLVPTERLVTRFDVPGVTRNAPTALLLPPGGAAAWNVRGPALWSATWEGPTGAPVPAPPGTLTLVRADGTAEVHPLATTTDPLAIADGIASVQVTLDAAAPPRRVLARLDGARGAWGLVPSVATGDGGLLVAPDLRQIELYRTGPGDDGIVWPLVGGEEARVSVRARLPSDALRAPPDPDAPPGVAEVAALDADGGVLGAWTLPLVALPSRFERPVSPDDLSTAAVADPVSGVVVVPPATTSLRVRADRTVDASLRVYRASPFLPARAPGYEPPEHLGAIVRYAPAEPAEWVARSPLDHEALARAGRVVRIDAQVRLDPVPEVSVDDASREWESLELPGRLDTLVEAGEALANPRTRVTTRGASVVVAPDGRLVVDYRVPADRVGVRARFSSGDVELDRPLVAAASRVVLDLPPGPRSLEVDVPGLFLAHAAGTPAWRAVRALALTAGRPAAIPLPAWARGVSVHVYERPGPPGRLEWSLDLPEVRPGVYVDRVSSTGRADLEGAEPAASLAIPGDLVERDAVVLWIPDTEPGPRALVVAVAGGRPAWVRLTATTAEGPAAAIAARAPGSGGEGPR